MGVVYSASSGLSYFWNFGSLALLSLIVQIFAVVYCHIFRGLYFGSYYAPRNKLWVSGVLILFIMIGTAFMGYVLPWGQMSFWAATVITNLASAIPIYGKSLVVWFWGAFSVDVPT